MEYHSVFQILPSCVKLQKSEATDLISTQKNQQVLVILGKLKVLAALRKFSRQSQDIPSRTRINGLLKGLKMVSVLIDLKTTFSQIFKAPLFYFSLNRQLILLLKCKCPQGNTVHHRTNEFYRLSFSTPDIKMNEWNQREKMKVLTEKDDKKGYWVNSNYSSVSVLLKSGPRLSKLSAPQQHCSVLKFINKHRSYADKMQTIQQND